MTGHPDRTGATLRDVRAAMGNEMNESPEPIMVKRLHRVTWSHGQPTFHCDGDINAPCHFFPDCECESWGQHCEAEHSRVRHADECWLLPWLENVEVECTWEGGQGYDKPAEHDAEIVTEWASDCVLWDYADESLANWLPLSRRPIAAAQKPSVVR